MSARKAKLARIFRNRLRSIQVGGPFRVCAECKRDLTRGDQPFVVTKDFNYGEVVIEYAICMECNEKHQHAWSDGSRRKVNQLFREAAGAQKEWEPVCEIEAIDGEELWSRPFDHCWMTGAELSLDEPFQIVTMVQGEAGMLLPTSFLLSNEGMELIQSSLSKHTRDERDRFKERVYPRNPPDWEDEPGFWDELELIGQKNSPHALH